MMGSVEEYKRTWLTREYVEIEALSACVKSIRFLILRLLHKLKFWLNIRPRSVFKDKKANRYLSSLHDKYVVVPADKAFNNIIFVCKYIYYECLIKELCISKNIDYPTNKNTSFEKEEFLQITNHLCHQWIFRLMKKMMN